MAASITSSASNSPWQAKKNGWNRWERKVRGCDQNGENCARGSEFSFSYFYKEQDFTFGGQTQLFADFNKPHANSGALYRTDEKACDAASNAAPVAYNNTQYLHLGRLELTNSGDLTMGLFLRDTWLSDNTGNITIGVYRQDIANIAPVPVPAGLLLMGTALVGLGFMRRRS